MGQAWPAAGALQRALPEERREKGLCIAYTSSMPRYISRTLCLEPNSIACYGTIPVKCGVLDGRIVQAAPEYDACKRAA